jgi:crotonobetainyl-CoA:carnitine CoA-transferase CaiB-like acyl-CoA transferase
MGPLAGINVLDLTAMVSGPVAAMMLADQGAEVIKVEPPGGEPMRHLGTPHNGVPAMFHSCNRGKKSIAIDLKADAGRRILRDLIARADVLLQNFRPGAMERMGFGEVAVRALNPGIVYVSISGFGEHGPYAHKRVYDPVIQALSGATDIQADRETGRPAMFRIIIADKVTALTAAQAVASALFHRERTGQGQHIRLSMLETMLAFFWPEGMTGLTYADREFDVRKEQGTLDLIFQTLDGYITAGAITNQEWAGMCRALGREELIDDERFATPRARARHADLRKRMVAEAVAGWTSADILERLDANDVPCAPLLSRMELLDHEQIRVNQSVQYAIYDGFGEVRQAVPAARFSATPSRIAGPAPLLGQHTHEILQGLGYVETERNALVNSAVVVASAVDAGSDAGA